jgi:hypothetical protein
MRDPLFPGCGEHCPSCVYFRGEKEPRCPGCRKIAGKPFWGECGVYSCFTGRGHAHCGLCGEFPCERFITHYEKSIPEGQRNAVTKAGILAYRARHGDKKTVELLKKIGWRSGKS